MKDNYNDSAAQLFSAGAGDITRGNKLEFGRFRVDMRKSFLGGREDQPWVRSPEISPSLELFMTQVNKAMASLIKCWG